MKGRVVDKFLTMTFVAGHLVAPVSAVHAESSRYFQPIDIVWAAATAAHKFCSGRGENPCTFVQNL